VITGFEIICIGRDCRESEDLSVLLSMSYLWIDMFTWFSITFATLLCAVCFMFQRWVRWQWSCRWRNVSSPCPQSHCAVAVSSHFLRFDLTGNCPGVRLSIQAWTAQSHMKQSAPHSCRHAAFGLAKNSPAWVFRDIVCHDIFSSCTLMHFFNVGH